MFYKEMKSSKSKDKKWMAHALKLASNGLGRVAPNPLVGAVIVKDDKLIGEGWHEYYGGLHAERNAIADCKRRGNDTEGATMYVTLEPCCHYGKTPPCTEAIIENRISRLVYGVSDPNPQVAGEGLKILSNSGINIEGPVLLDECRNINEIFFHYISSNMPYVILKYAMTADGKISSYTGDSRWITGHTARQDVHLTRKRVSAIMVGINTVLTDNPMLNCRLDEQDSSVCFDPVRIICDSRLRLPFDSAIVKSADKIRTVAVHISVENEEMSRRAAKLKACGVELLEVAADREGHTDISCAMQALGKLKVDSVLLEGGSELAWSALEAGLVQKLQVYVGSKIVGGVTAKHPVGGIGFEKMAQAVKLGSPRIEVLGNDVLLEYDVIKES